MAVEGNIGMTAIKPVGWDRTGCEAFKYFLYNPETGEILSRTPISWLKITVFYTIYYSLLACFWIGCLNIFFLTLPEGHPRWMLDASIIGNNPGLGLRPASTDERIDSAIIMLKIGERDGKPTNPEGEGDKNIDYAVRAEKYMKMYNDTSGLVNCSDNAVRGEEQDGCIFPLAELGECSEFPYGFTVRTTEVGHQSGYNPGGAKFVEPCLFLKLNKIFDWKPEPIKCEPDSCAEKLEKYDKMSPHLKNRIAEYSRKNDSGYVWVDCFGRYAADKEALNMEYFPKNQGMPIKYFPYRGGNYHTPLVAVKMKISETASCTNRSSPPHIAASNCGQLLQVECRAYFEGVKHDTRDKAGLVQFEVLISPGGDEPYYVSEHPGGGRQAPEHQHEHEEAEEE